MFCDEAKIHLKAGDGGNGKVNFLHEKGREFGGPDGGDGGKGGDIIFKASKSQNTLYFYKTNRLLKAKNGEGGLQRKKRGKGAPDKVLEVPEGTIITDTDGKVLADLSQDNPENVILKGGEGGFGNAHFSTSIRQAPKVAELGETGEEMDVILELKLIADVGLVGLPNAGKSMLLSVISKAKPKVANYPFTTLVPNLGVVEGKRFGLTAGEGFIVCDIPGLIEDASKGKGLGDEFLKHVERTRLLVHLIDVTEKDITANLNTIQKELKSYKKEVSKKPQIIVLTKADLLKEEEIKEKIKEIKKYITSKKYTNIEKNNIFVISSVSHKGLRELMLSVYNQLDKLSKITEEVKKKEEYKVFTLKDIKKDDFKVTKKGKIYIIQGDKIEKFFRKTDFSNPHAIMRLRDIMKKMGIAKELTGKGAKEGDVLKVGDKKINF